jgi:hypothetical protein
MRESVGVGLADLQEIARNRNQGDVWRAAPSRKLKTSEQSRIAIED